MKKGMKRIPAPLWKTSNSFSFKKIVPHDYLITATIPHHVDRNEIFFELPDDNKHSE
jgi:hypothetical protein